MFNISNICKKYCYQTYIVVHARNKSKTHWAKLRRKNSPKDKALNHFDDFYGSVFGSKWESIKEAMFRRSKYVALVNNFGDTEETTELLSNRGAHCLKKLMSVQQEFHNEYSPKPTEPPPANNERLKDYLERVQTEDISRVYPQAEGAPERLDYTDKRDDGKRETLQLNKSEFDKDEDSSESLAQSQMDGSRIIDPSMRISSEALYQYIPATKLKGMDEWVPESLHYSYYSTNHDFPLVMEPETEFKMPEHLKVYTYEMDSEWSMFPEPKRCQTGVFNYYPMDCGSILSVLALCLAPGDRVLDVCAAPGGKSLAALQTLLPDVLVANDTSLSRCNRMKRVFNDYLYDYKSSNRWHERVLVSNQDARDFTDDRGFDKVLVDVPCTTDRVSLNEDENNIFRPDRIKERLRLPELQTQILTHALRLVRVGGAVVYATCSLSPVQNDGVLHAALRRAFSDHNVHAAVKDLTAPMSALSSTLTLATGDIAPRYGQLVLPSIGANFGPSYIARLVRIK